MERFTRKIGRNRGKPRLWIEGAQLIKAGFKPGDKWRIRSYSDGFAILLLDPTDVADLKIRTISGKGNRPIVDIIGGALGDAVSEAAMVECSYKPGSGRIVVKVAS